MSLLAAFRDAGRWLKLLTGASTATAILFAAWLATSNLAVGRAGLAALAVHMLALAGYLLRGQPREVRADA